MRCSLAMGFFTLAVGALALVVPLPSTEVQSLYPDLYEPGPVSAPVPPHTHSGPVYHLPPFYNRRIPIDEETPLPPPMHPRTSNHLPPFYSGRIPILKETPLPHPFGVASSTLSTVTTTTSVSSTQPQTFSPTKTATATHTHPILPRQTELEKLRITVAEMIDQAMEKRRNKLPKLTIPNSTITSSSTNTATATHQILPRQTDMEGWRATVAAMMEEFRANVAAKMDQAMENSSTDTATATHQILPRQNDMEGWRATVAAMMEEFRANVSATIDQAYGEAQE
jgi:hypothetical protein